MEATLLGNLLVAHLGPNLFLGRLIMSAAIRLLLNLLVVLALLVRRLGVPFLAECLLVCLVLSLLLR